MKENQVSRMAYHKPRIEAFYVKIESHLLETSYPGDHQPGVHKPGPGEEEEAKRNSFFGNEEEIENVW